MFDGDGGWLGARRIQCPTSITAIEDIDADEAKALKSLASETTEKLLEAMPP